MTDSTPRHLHLPGIRLNVVDAGAGTPILLLHGFPDSSELWREVTPHLVAAGHRVIAPDLRGFGDSEAPAGQRHYSVEAVLADLLALLGQLGVGEPVLVMGHDWGAVIAWCLAMFHPERVAASVVLSVGHPREYAWAGLEQKRKGAYTLAWQLPGIAEARLSRNDWAGLRHWARDHPEVERCIRDLARPGRLTAALGWYRANLVRVMLGSWPRCRVPTLGVWSTGDHCLAEDQMRNSARRMDAPWHYERIANAAHWLPLEQPAQIAALALDWFRRA